MTGKMTNEAVVVAAIAADWRRRLARITIKCAGAERGDGIVVVMNLANVALQNQGENQQSGAQELRQIPVFASRASSS